MRATAKLTSKGQVTVPAKIRQRFGLRTGDSMTFVVKNGALSVVPGRTDGSVLDKWRGIGNPGLPSGREAIIAYVRELRGHDEFD